LLNTLTVLDVTVVAEFEGALIMVSHIAATTGQVEFHPDPLPDELKVLIREWRRLIRVDTVTQRPEDKVALNRLHRRIRKELLAHHNRLWEIKLSNTSNNNCKGRAFCGSSKKIQ
jgi:hypothetical protein